MTLASGFITFYTWAFVCIILYFLFAIARFYQEKSGQRSYYALYLIAIGLYSLAAIRYIWLSPVIIGDFWGDSLRFAAGALVIGSAYYLLKLMIGRR
ncbi:MAG: hypothetical protein FOGNACKC_01640 [Anaerolineae bacterium]|nr:hypothetical protein [Anaerolineae bacterium]